MAKSIWPLIEERIPEILQWTRSGMTAVEICKKIGISKNAFYKHMSQHSDFAHAYAEAMRDPNEAVEAALYKLCVGHKIKEVKTEHRYIDGEKVDIVTETEKEVSPSCAAIEFWLCNRVKDRWQRQPDVVAAVTQESGVIMMPPVVEDNSPAVETT